MKIQVRRVYDAATKSDGFRVLADRLWPRGVSKASAKIDFWAKEVTPSSKLRTWFHKDQEGRFIDFSKLYKQELVKSREINNLKAMLPARGMITIVTGVKDIEHSHIPTLTKMLFE